MGLAYSINTKALATISSPFYKGAVMEMQGKRHEMEDEFLIMNNIPNHSHKSVFGVFDGHAGTLASAFMKNKLPEKLPSLKSFDTSALTELNLLLDQELIKHKDYVDQGSCSTFAIIDFAKRSEIDITISHVGDSRAILIHSNEINQLTTDHKPRLPEESERIELAGGSVSFDGRVDGMLAVSRAMGDIEFKRNNNLPPTEQKVIAVPEVSMAKAVPGDILFISCDGFFEKLSTEEVGRFLIEKMKQAQHPLDALRALFEYNTDRSGDNMTAILLQFTEHNQDVEYQIQHSIEYGRIHTKSGGWLRTYTANLERYGKRLEDAEEYWKQLKKEAQL